MVKGAVELVHGARAEGIADLGTIERDTDPRQVLDHFTVVVSFHAAVVGNVLQVLKALHLSPLLGVENLGYLLGKLRVGHGYHFRWECGQAWEVLVRPTLSGGLSVGTLTLCQLFLTLNVKNP